MNPAVIFFVAAGSGGHINPAVTLAQQALKQNEKVTIHFFTGTKTLEQTLARKLTEAHHHSCRLGQFSLRRWWQIPLHIGNCIKIIYQSYKLARKYNPQEIVTTGSFLALPVCLGAWLAGTPVTVYELNVEPGKSVKALFPLAKKIHCVFPKTVDAQDFITQRYRHKMVISPYPLRFTPQDYSQKDALQAISSRTQIPFNCDRTIRTIFVLGGSQGSVFLNEALIYWIESSKPSNIQVIHQTGQRDAERIKSFYQKNDITAYVFDYDHDIQTLYQAADIIVCRAGAGTLFEIAAYKKMALIIPLTAHTTSHQVANAHEIAKLHPNTMFVIDDQDDTIKKRALQKKLDTLIS